MEPRAEMSFKHLLLSRESCVLFPVLLKATQEQAKPHHLTVNFRPTFLLPLLYKRAQRESQDHVSVGGVRSGDDWWPMCAFPAFNSLLWVDHTIHYRTGERELWRRQGTCSKFQTTNRRNCSTSESPQPHNHFLYP